MIRDKKRAGDGRDPDRLRRRRPRGSQRGLEYDTVSAVYAFIETEVLPGHRQGLGLGNSHRPGGRATMGGVPAGRAAFTMAWFRPDLYRRVLTYQGTYVNQQSPVNPDVAARGLGVPREPDPQSERKPLRVWLEVERERQRVEARRGHAAQLGAGQPAHGRRLRRRGTLPLRLREGRRAHGRARHPPDAPRDAAVALARLPNQVSK